MPSKSIGRRAFMVSGAAGAALILGGLSRTARGTPLEAVTYLVPGYDEGDAFRRGRPLVEDPEAARALPKGYGGESTMVTRVEMAKDQVKRALFPISGHQIAVHPDRDRAYFVGMNHPALLLIDPVSLDLVSAGEPHRDDFVFGGHACFSSDGSALFVTERLEPLRAYGGSPVAHYGVISVRDPEDLRVRAVYSCHGIAPHEIAFLQDGGGLAVANYGSTGWPAGREAPAAGLPYGVEPSLTLVDAADGRLIRKVLAPRRPNEVRHLAAYSRERILAMQVRPTSFDDAQRALADRSEIYQADDTDRYGRGFLAQPVLHIDFSGSEDRVNPVIGDADAMQRGQSIVYDPAHDEVLATFTSSNTLVVFNAADGAIRRVLRTDRLGLRRPRGLALLPDGRHYAVSGSWENIFVFRRGGHQLVRDACRYDLLFGHSHLTVL